MHQIVLPNPGRVLAALGFPGRAVVIDVPLPLIDVRFSGHPPPAAAADEQPGEHIHRILLRSGPGIQLGQLLDQVKIPFADDGLVGTLHPGPILHGLLHYIFQLVVGGRGLTLNQDAGIGLILQNTDDCRGRPLGVRAVREALGRMGQPTADLVGQRRENTLTVQFLGDFVGAGALDTAAVDVLHHQGGVLVNDQMISVLRVLLISIDGAGPHIGPAFSFGLERRPGAHRAGPANRVIGHSLDGNQELVPALLMRCIDIIVDGDEADAIGRKNPAQVTAGLNMLPAQAGDVLHNDAVDFPRLDVVHHGQKGRPVEQDAAVTVVHLL